MPICSYVVEPAPGQCAQVTSTLNTLPGCEATAADHGELIILLTETADEAGDEALQHAFRTVKGIANMTLTFGQIQHHSEAEEAAHV